MNREKMTMGKKQKPDLDCHLAIADHLAQVNWHLFKATAIINRTLPKTGQVSIALTKMHKDYSSLKSRLDDEYHSIISDDEFKEHGHIYYNLNERYERLRSSGEELKNAQLDNQSETDCI